RHHRPNSQSEAIISLRLLGQYKLEIDSESGLEMC
ncbi:MAG: hypothetical protein RLZZ574_697, partial [Cyanobacteriota bacterium]